jgi:hypothetical protein
LKIAFQWQVSRVMQLVVTDRIAALLETACKHNSVPEVRHALETVHHSSFILLTAVVLIGRS